MACTVEGMVCPEHRGADPDPDPDPDPRSCPEPRKPLSSPGQAFLNGTHTCVLRGLQDTGIDTHVAWPTSDLSLLRRRYMDSV
jgi:hypothetical protein